MNRRRFLAMLSAATASGGGLATSIVARGRSERSADEPAEASEVADAVGASDRIGTRHLVWSGETREPVVALTFDDGPDPELTPRILEILGRFGIPATFCVMGHNAVRHPELLRAAVAQGHELGSHTWSHLNLARQSVEETRRQISLCGDAIRAAADVEVRYFRPPYGRLTGTAARYAATMGYDVILWSLGRGVGGVGTPDAVANHVAGSLNAGDIVLLHDGVGRETFDTEIEGRGPVRQRRAVEVRALPQIIERGLEKGFRFVTVSDLLRASTRSV